MKLFALILSLAIGSQLSLAAQQDSLLVVFWNVENFFHYEAEQRPQYWTRGRFYTKCDAIAKTLLMISDQFGRYPDIIAFAEVDSRSTLSSLRSTTPLRKLGYKIVHYDSPDRRGIDCALLYRESRLNLLSSKPIHIYDNSHVPLPTRDILLAEFVQLSILVNHHPSKIGGKSARRELAMSRMKHVADSLLPRSPVLAVGDFNEQLWDGVDEQLSQSGLYPATGTLKYNGTWEKIDGFFAFGKIDVQETIFAHRVLLTEDKAFGGLKPRRTFVGPRYEAGVSDHLPIVLWLRF